MNEELITFETAKLAKEKGFNEPVLAIYSGNQLGYIQEGDTLFRKWNHCADATYSAPTQALLQKWLREVHNIEVYVNPYYYGDDQHGYIYYANSIKSSRRFDTYEEALEKGLQEALKLIK